MEESKYIYIQLAQEIHEDKPRILVASENISETIYIEDLTDEEGQIVQNLINLINTKINASNS